MPVARRALVAVAGLVLAACGDSSPTRPEPDGPETSSTTVTAVAPETTTTTAALVAVEEPPPVEAAVPAPEPILCPSLRHPAHHSPCPARTTSHTHAPARTTGGAGGNLATIRECESGGDYGAVSGPYRGAYQFDRQTHLSVGGDGNAADDSPAEQDAAAQRLMDQRGTQPWPVCGRR